MLLHLWVIIAVKSLHVEGLSFASHLSSKRQSLSSLYATIKESGGRSTRRQWAKDLLVQSTFISSSAMIAAQPSWADVDMGIEMKEFIDPKGLFSISVPKRFYTLRRTSKGDLPDEKTGKDGRRGSSIFTAGDMAKAEVIAIERYPAKLLLQEEGILVREDEVLSKISSLGQPRAVAELIMRRRERDRPGQASRTVVDAVQLSDDGTTLTFQTRSDIDVQKPELLMETMGVDKLTRVSSAKAILQPDGIFMIVFASALEMDYRGIDGQALQESVNSFALS